MTAKVLAFAVALGLVTSVTSLCAAAVPAGTKLINQASLSYSDGHNNLFNSLSNQVSVTAAAVSGIAVTPNENGCTVATDSVAAGHLFQKTFTIVNGGNIADAFTIVSATASAGTLVAAQFSQNGKLLAVPATGPTVSPQIPIGGQIQVVITANTNTVAIGTPIILTLAVSTTAQTVNGNSSGSAKQCALPEAPPELSGIAGPKSPIQKLVNGLPATQSSQGKTVTYSISFENYGATAATGVTITDTLPAGISPITTNVTVNGNALPTTAIIQTGQQLQFLIGNVPPLTKTVVLFTGLVTEADATGIVAVNVAQISGTNIDPTRTSPAAVMVGSENVVFDGETGSNTPISGANVMLVQNLGQGAIPAAGVVLTGIAIAPNTKNSNPYITDATGTYALGISPKAAAAGLYDLIISAPGYITRKIQLKLSPDPTGSYYAVVATALDGEPLTVPGAFNLDRKPQSIAATYGLFGNIPMFHAQSVVITKLVDKDVASAGDRLIYTINVANNGNPLGQATITDTLPAGIRYAPGTGLLNTTPAEPEIRGNQLTWSIPTLTTQNVIKFAAVILPNIGEETSVTNLATVVAHIVTSPTFTVSAQSNVTTNIIAGLFTDRSIITGRVYIDAEGSGRFEQGDHGIPNVRLFLEDGESVSTDSDGKYDFPSVRPGMHVLKIDRLTLPKNVAPFDDRRIDHERSLRRIVNNPFEGGLLNDINFAVRAVPQ